MKNIKVLQINSGNFGSTGSIMLGIAEKLKEKNGISFFAYPSSRTNNSKKIKNVIKIGNRMSRNLHLKLAYLTGNNGCYSKFSTYLFLKRIDKLNPDIIHLHNLHNCYINLEIFFKYLKEKKIPVVWTLHDCWSFTGQCPHFSAINCFKWRNGCHDCAKFRDYPMARIDRTEIMYKKKRDYFSGVEKLVIVTPSEWLRETVKKSYLKDYKIKTIYNGIDLKKFKPTESNFREKYKLENKKIILGVASSWSQNKGLKIFEELEKKIDKDYKLVLVGLNKEQKEKVSNNIIKIDLLSSKEELAKIYTCADIFINPSIEETFGLVTAEALACGTPAIVSNKTAVPEVINSSSGIVVEENNVDFYLEAIKRLNLNKKNCIKRSYDFDEKKKYEEYIDLYKTLLFNSDVKEER